MIHQTVLPFKLEVTRDTITAHAGLALLGEFCVGLDLIKVVNGRLPEAGSGAGYQASEYVFALVLMLAGGGRSLEDLREIRGDEGLKELLALKRVPSSDAAGDWLRRMGGGKGLGGLARVNRRFLKPHEIAPGTQVTAPGASHDQGGGGDDLQGIYWLYADGGEFS